MAAPLTGASRSRRPVQPLPAEELHPTRMPAAPAARGCRSADWPRGSTWRPCPPCPGLPFFGKLQKVHVWPGSAYPLGATWDGSDTNFALFSEVADRVELCLFNRRDRSETRVELTEVDGFVWHCYLPGVGAGQQYGYRVHGRTRRAAASGATRRSCCPTRTARPSRASSAGARPCSPTGPARQMPSTLATVPPLSRAMSLSIRISTGAMTGRRRLRITRR